VLGNPMSDIDPEGLQSGSIKSPTQAQLMCKVAGLSAWCPKPPTAMSASAQVGGTMVAGLGISSSAGVAVSTTGKACTVHNICGLAGPMVGGFVTASGSVSTGGVTPGSSCWVVSGVGAAAIGAAGKAELSVASDGSLALSGGTGFGGGIGGAVQVCYQKVSNICN